MCNVLLLVIILSIPRRDYFFWIACLLTMVSPLSNQLLLYFALVCLLWSHHCQINQLLYFALRSLTHRIMDTTKRTYGLFKHKPLPTIQPLTAYMDTTQQIRTSFCVGHWWCVELFLFCMLVDVVRYINEGGSRTPKIYFFKYVAEQHPLRSQPC